MATYPLFPLICVLTLHACTARQAASSTPADDHSSASSLSQAIFVGACTAADKSSDAVLAQALMRSVEAKDCRSAWDRLASSRRMMLAGFRLQDIKLLAVFPDLEEVALTDNWISDLKPLGSLKKLSSLNLSFNRIRDLTGLEGSINLRELSLSGNEISSLAPLSSLQNLRALDISENQVQGLAALAPLQNLVSLRIADNAVRDLSPLSHHFALEQLSLERNLVESLKPISSLPRLVGRRLRVEGNPVKKAGCPTNGDSAAVTAYCLSLRDITP